MQLKAAFRVSAMCVRAHARARYILQLANSFIADINVGNVARSKKN